MQATTVFPSRATEYGSELGLLVRASVLLDRGIFYSLIAIITLSAIPYGAVYPWWVALFECGVFALTSLAIIHGALDGPRGRIEWLTIAPLVALVLFAFVQTLPIWRGSTSGLTGDASRIALSADPYETRLWILHVCALILTGALLVRYTSDQRRMRVLVLAVVVIAVASAIYGVVRHVTHLPLPVYGTQIPPADGGFGQYFNRNHFALLMEMALGLTSGIIFVGVKRAHLPFYLATVALLWSALVLSNSRGGILSMIGQFLFLISLWNLARPEHKAPKVNRFGFDRFRRFGQTIVARVLLAGCLLTTLAVGVVWLGGDALMHRLEVSHRELESENSSRLNARRLAIWQATLLMIRDNPIAGVGFGGYRTAIPAYHDASGRWTPQEAHNDYLELMASGGIIGVAFVVWVIAVFGKKAWRRLTHADDAFSRASCVGALVGLFGVAVHSLVDFGLHVTINAVVCIALLVIATRRVKTVAMPIQQW